MDSLMDPMVIQGLAAVLLPLLVQMLKLAIPGLEGKVLFWANLILNIAVAVAVALGIEGVDPTAVLTIGAGAGLAGSKVIDIGKARTVLVSDRHKG